MKKLNRIMMLAAALLTAAALQAQTTITVLSDTHVMGPGLLLKDGAAWQKAIAKERKMHEQSRHIMETVADRALDRKAHLLLITGDLTKDGELISHQFVVQQLDKLRAAGIKCFVIPGNHDLGTKNALIFDGNQTRPATTVDADKFAALYQHYGYGPGSVRDTASLSYCCEPVDGLVLIGIDSGRQGTVGQATLDWVCGKAEEATRQGKRVLAMMHHSLLDHFNREGELIAHSVVEQNEAMRNRLADAGVQVILTGHFHVSDIAKDYNADLSRHIYDISTGSTTTYPCDFREMTLSADLAQLDIKTVRLTDLPGKERLREQSKERMAGGARALVGKLVKNDIIDRMAAAALIIFAEGNEDQSEAAQEILGTFAFGKQLVAGNPAVTEHLKKAGLTFSEVEAVLYSILTDHSSYGIKGREDKTDDLTLTIKWQ